MPPRPDFFIVGAPKSGTTAMTDYLAQHPEIGMCERKETQHFATDLYPSFGVEEGRVWRTTKEYLSLFAGVQEVRRIGEASVWYLYSRRAARLINEFSPQADIIVMLRNPFDALPSLHSQFVFVGIEPVEDFATALALDPERERNGGPKRFPPRSYRSAARYSEQLARYFEVFGRERIHVIIYDDFRDGTAEAYRQTCEFLGVDMDFLPEIRVVNPNKRVRSRLVRTLGRQTPEPLRKVLHATTSQGLRRRAALALKEWNTRFEPREPTPETVERSLRPVVEHQVDALGRMLDVNLSFWLDR